MKTVELKIDPSLSKELVVRDKIFRSTCDFYLTERDLEKARNELKETEEKRRTCLEELKKMLNKDERTRYRMDDDYLIRFLRFRKYDVLKAYKFIQYFYKRRNEDPELFTLPSDVEFRLKGNFVALLPYTNEDGVMVYLHQLRCWEPSEMSVRDLCVLCSYASDVTTMNPHAQINGVMDIFDFGGMSARQLSELMQPHSLKLLSKFLQELYPWRIKKVIAFNVNALVYASVCVIRYFMKKKVADRFVVIRSDLKELHKHVNPEILPKEYGGKLDEEEYRSYLKEIIFSNKEYLKYENSFIECNQSEQELYGTER